MRMSDALVVVGQYTADQWGMITTAQAIHAGVDSVTLYRLTDAGHLETVKHGVYAAATAPASPHRDVQAAWLALEPSVPAWERSKLDLDGGVASHRTAALIHELGDMITDSIELTVPHRRATRDPFVRLRQRHLDEDDVVLVDGLPVTSVERTIEDLLADHVDARHVAGAIADAVQTHQLDLDRLGDRIGRYCRRYGVKGQAGGNLIDHLLEHIGTSRANLSSTPSPALRTFEGLRPDPALQRAVQQAAAHAFAAQLAPVRKQLEQIQQAVDRSSGQDKDNER